MLSTQEWEKAGFIRLLRDLVGCGTPPQSSRGDRRTKGRFLLQNAQRSIDGRGFATFPKAWSLSASSMGKRQRYPWVHYFQTQSFQGSSGSTMPIYILLLSYLCLAIILPHPTHQCRFMCISKRVCMQGRYRSRIRASENV